MLNICGIVVAILKMASGRNFSMLRINSGHHYLPIYQILMEEQFCAFKTFKMSAIVKMAAKTWHKKCVVKIQHCLISLKFDIWVDNDVLN
jgi:hypothetical protein